MIYITQKILNNCVTMMNQLCGHQLYICKKLRFYFTKFPNINHHFRKQIDNCSEEIIQHINIINMSKSSEMSNLYKLFNLTNIEFKEHDQKSEAYEINKSKNISEFVHKFYEDDFKLFSQYLITS